MKKAILIGVLLITILTACKNDFDESASQKIIGKWRVKSIESKETTGGVVQSDYVVSYDSIDNYWNFKNDSTLYTYYQYDISPDTSKYKIKDGVLLISTGIQITVPKTIKKITDNLLLLSMRHDDYAYTLEYTMTLIR